MREYHKGNIFATLHTDTDARTISIGLNEFCFVLIAIAGVIISTHATFAAYFRIYFSTYSMCPYQNAFGSMDLDGF
jgi:hypothetical protein